MSARSCQPGVATRLLGGGPQCGQTTSSLGSEGESQRQLLSSDAEEAARSQGHPHGTIGKKLAFAAFVIGVAMVCVARAARVGGTFASHLRPGGDNKVQGVAMASLLQGLSEEPASTEEALGANGVEDTLHDGTPAEEIMKRVAPDVPAGASRRRPAWHWTLPCWYQCGGRAGLCEDHCGPLGSCCMYGNLTDPHACHGVRNWPTKLYHTCVLGSPKKALMAAQHITRTQGAAPLYRFYVYRAQGDANAVYPFGNVNSGNLPGVMWYLANEVLPRCPKRYGINRILRFIVTTRATPELFARGMNWGIRYSYDKGKCTGSNIANLGKCDLTWKRFGYVPGCNNFKDHYPWPLADTCYPNGIWYDFPGEGKCDFPTGSWNCTWSAEPAGEISIEQELEASVPGSNYRCHGKSTNFWKNAHNTRQCGDRVERALDAFKATHQGQPRDLPAPICDFDRSQFWAGWKDVQ